MYVEVFKTNVQHPNEASKLLKVLMENFPECSFNFDLEDRDKILRAKGKKVIHNTRGVMNLVAATGHHIEVLPD